MARSSPFETDEETTTGYGSLGERAQNMMSSATEQGSRAITQAERTAEDAYYATRRFMEEQPLVALATITAFAFAVGALWRLTSRRRYFGEDLVSRVTDYLEPQYRAMRRRM